MRVSIITLTTEYLDSILDQNYPDIEIMVCCLTDQAMMEAGAYHRQDQRVKNIRCPYDNYHEARNHVLPYSTGMLVCAFDSPMPQGLIKRWVNHFEFNDDIYITRGQDNMIHRYDILDIRYSDRMFQKLSGERIDDSSHL